MSPRHAAPALLSLLISWPAGTSAESGDGPVVGGGTGACCFGGGFCEVLTEEECLEQGGFYEGDGTHCGALSCIGACCLDHDCTVLPPGDCDDSGGTFLGFGTACDPDPCTATDVPRAGTAVEGVELSAPYPNPTVGPIRFRVSLARAARVRVRVLDVTGRIVATLIDGELPEGARSYFWAPGQEPGRRLGGGVYFLSLESERARPVQKFVMIDTFSAIFLPSPAN